MLHEAAGDRAAPIKTDGPAGAPQPIEGKPARSLYWKLDRIDALFAAVTLLSLLPLWLVRYPQSVDYLNHLVRLFVLTAPAADPIHDFYRVNWHLMPNLGLEIVAWPLLQLLPLEPAMKIVWSLGILGMGFAVWFLHRSLTVRAQPTVLFGTVALFNTPMTVGLINFVLGLQVAFIAIGLWFRMGARATRRSLLMLNLLAALALLLHVAAVMALAATVGVVVLFQRPFQLAAVARRAAILAAGFIAPALLGLAMALSKTAPQSPIDSSAVFYLLNQKAMLFAVPTYTGIFAADLIGALGFWPVLLLAFLGRRAKVPAAIGTALLMWVIIVLALPFGFGTAAFIDQRAAFVPAMLLVAGLSFKPESRRFSEVLGAVAMACALARIMVLVPAAREHNAHVEAFRAIEPAIAARSKVLVAASPLPTHACTLHLAWPNFEEHIPTLLVMDQRDFVLSLFDMPDVQPIEAVGSLATIGPPNIGVLSWELLTAAESEAGRQKIAAMPAAPILLAIPSDWRQAYDYIAVHQTPCTGKMPPQADFVLLGESLSYRIYRITHPPAS
jgi:hypothetical protein